MNTLIMTVTARMYAAAPNAPGSSSTRTKKPVTINILDGAGAPGLSALQHLINIAAVIVISLASPCCSTWPTAGARECPADGPLPGPAAAPVAARDRGRRRRDAGRAGHRVGAVGPGVRFADDAQRGRVPRWT